MEDRETKIIYETEDAQLFLELILMLDSIKIYLVRYDTFSEFPFTLGVVVEKSNSEYYYSSNSKDVPIDEFGRGSIPESVEDVQFGKEKFVDILFEIPARWNYGYKTIRFYLNKAKDLREAINKVLEQHSDIWIEIAQEVRHDSIENSRTT